MMPTEQVPARGSIFLDSLGGPRGRMRSNGKQIR